MNKLKSNFLYDAVYQVLILIIPLITTPYVARTIGAEGVGIYSYTYSIVYYFMMFALLGMNNYGNREISKVKDNQEKLNETFSGIYFLQLITTSIVLIIYILYINLFDNKYFQISIIQSIYIVSVAFDINWLFCGLQKFKITVTRSAIIKVLTLILIFIFVKNENDLWKYISILAITTLLNQLILWPFLRKDVKFVKVKFKNIIKHLKPTIILFIPLLASSVYRLMDKIMVGNISNVTEVGYYENAEKMLNIVLSVTNALGTVTLPQMTYLHSQGKMDEYYRILDKSIIFIFFLVFPIIFGFLATADVLVDIYLGSEFAKSAVLLKLLTITLLFTPVASIVRMQLLIPRNKDKEYTISVIVGAIINFCLNMILIKYYQSVGATIATIIAEAAVSIIQFYFVRKELNFKKYMADIGKIALKSIIMFGVVCLVGIGFKNQLMKLVVQVMVGIAIYGILNWNFINSQINLKNLFKEKKGEEEG